MYVASGEVFVDFGGVVVYYKMTHKMCCYALKRGSGQNLRRQVPAPPQ